MIWLFLISALVLILAYVDVRLTETNEGLAQLVGFDDNDPQTWAKR